MAVFLQIDCSVRTLSISLLRARTNLIIEASRRLYKLVQLGKVLEVLPFDTVGFGMQRRNLVAF